MTAPPSQPINLDGASFAHMVSSVLTALSPDPLGTPEHHAIQRDSAAAALGDLRPQGPVQHMLAARTVAARYAAMDAFRRASLAGAAEDASTRHRRIAASMSRLADDTQRRLQAHQRTLRQGIPTRLAHATLRVPTTDILAAAARTATPEAPAPDQGTPTVAKRAPAMPATVRAASKTQDRRAPEQERMPPCDFPHDTPYTRTEPQRGQAQGGGKWLPPELAPAAACAGALAVDRLVTPKDLAAHTRAALLATTSHPALMQASD